MLPASGTHKLATRDLVFAVSDGMGGANAGDLASSLILGKMSEIIPETFKIAASGFYPDCLEFLESAIDSVHRHINEATTEQTKGMAATLAMAWFTPENLYIANAGDSRIYLLRDGDLRQVSRDHTMAWGQWTRGEISEFEYRNHPRRSALYGVIGGGHDRVSPHFDVIPYQIGDRFLLCTDGLIDGLWERNIKNGLRDGANPQSGAESLLKRAVENSGIDDTTLIVIEVQSEPESTCS